MPPPQPRRSVGNQLDETNTLSDIRKRRSLGSHGDKSPASNPGESSKPFRHKRVTNTNRTNPGQSPMSERQQMALLLQMTSPDAELSPNNQNNHKPRERNERGETLLHIAAKKGDLEGAKKLLEQGSNPNVTDFAGWTPLHEAANHGHYHLAQLLIKHGANVMATGFDDITPLHDAAMYGNQRLVELLIEKGADPMFKNKKGKAPYEVPHHSLVGFFNDLINEMANKQQQKKSSSSAATTSGSSGNSNGGDLKKASGGGEVGEESNTMASSSSAPSDVYEFVSTPKHSSCSSGDENPIGKSFDKSSDDKSGTDSDTPSMSTSNTTATVSTASNVATNVQQKRALGDQLDKNDDNLSPADEDSKRKKRKDSEFPIKDNSSGNSVGGNKTNTSSTSNQGVNRVTSRIGKPPGPASKTMGLMNKTGNQLDRKSESPKMSTVKSPAETVEIENDDLKGNSAEGGPKVPPLKIVIPQQSTSSSNTNETQDGSQSTNQRTNKTTAARNATSGLPYVINSTSNTNENAVASANEKDGANSSNLTASSSAVTNVVLSTLLRSQSPSADSNKSNDDSKSASASGKSKEPRILRSSQRSGKDSKDDRSSNNSSPQLPASSTPSPAAHHTDSSVGTESDHQQVNMANSSQPSNSVASSSATTSTASIQSSTQSTQIASNQSSQLNQQQQLANSNATTSSNVAASSSSQSSVELHPRKRKIKASSKEPQSSSSSSSASSTADLKDSNSKDGQEKSNEPVHPHDQPFTNCYQMYIDLRKQIQQRHNSLHPIEPRPLKGLEDYLMNRRTYSLQGKTPLEPPNIIIPPLLPAPMKETFVEQEKERHRLKLKHIVEKEKLVLSKEQEILRVHCKAAQMIANQSQPFSVCTMLKDEEVYNIITPEQEEKYRNKNRERSHGRVFYQALKELDDKWDKIKEAMIIRHTNESESLHAVQKMDWGWKLKELALCDYKATPEIEELHVPMVDVSDEYTTPSTSD